MPLLNRVFKGTGDKYLSSELFWNSELGQLCEASFNEVTSDTFKYLLEVSTPLREKITTEGGRVSYIAYGYHGTAVLVGGAYTWQSYTPYVQGIAKMRLETVAAEAYGKGISATVFNCPEIQTNSSALFLGVEISLYPLLEAIRRQVGDVASAPLFERCQQMLKEGEDVTGLLARADQYLSSPIITAITDFKTWPQHNTPEQAELMLTASAELMGMHADQKQLVCAELSRIVFLSTGRLMLHASWSPGASTLWLNHDIIARLLADIGLGHAKLVNTVTDGFEGLIHGQVFKIFDIGFGGGQHVTDLPVTGIFPDGDIHIAETIAQQRIQGLLLFLLQKREFKLPRAHQMRTQDQNFLFPGFKPQILTASACIVLAQLVLTSGAVAASAQADVMASSSPKRVGRRMPRASVLVSVRARKVAAQRSWWAGGRRGKISSACWLRAWASVPTAS